MFEWGSNYSTGAILLTLRDGKLQFAVSVEHTGDCHHKFAVVEAVREVGENGKPSDADYITATGEFFSGYDVGPQVGRISTEEILSLSSGVRVPTLKITASVVAFANVLNTSASRSHQ
ncbi:MAG: hypothetical protein WBP22_03735 [Candidatus Saccharimonas sp.]